MYRKRTFQVKRNRINVGNWVLCGLIAAIVLVLVSRIGYMAFGPIEQERLAQIRAIAKSGLTRAANIQTDYAKMKQDPNFALVSELAVKEGWYTIIAELPAQINQITEEQSRELVNSARKNFGGARIDLDAIVWATRRRVDDEFLTAEKARQIFHSVGDAKSHPNRMLYLSELNYGDVLDSARIADEIVAEEKARNEEKGHRLALRVRKAFGRLSELTARYRQIREELAKPNPNYLVIIENQEELAEQAEKLFLFTDRLEKESQRVSKKPARNSPQAKLEAETKS